MAVAFFNPTAVSTVLTDWVVQNDNLGISSDVSGGLRADGDSYGTGAGETDSVTLFNQKTSTKPTMKCFIATGDLTLAAVGDLITLTAPAVAQHCDTVNLKLNVGDFPELSLDLHTHGSSAHPACRVYEGSPTFAAGRGIPVAPGGFALVDATNGWSSFDYTISAKHTDEPGGDGETLASENNDGTEVVNCTVLGNGGVTPPVAVPVWREVTSDSDRSNNTAEKSKHTFSRHLAFTPAVP
jgi:hypothetical protein